MAKGITLAAAAQPALMATKGHSKSLHPPWSCPLSPELVKAEGPGMPHQCHPWVMQRFYLQSETWRQRHQRQGQRAQRHGSGVEY